MENRMKSIAQRLEEHASPTPSKWRELFDFLETNKSWLIPNSSILSSISMAIFCECRSQDLFVSRKSNSSRHSKALEKHVLQAFVR